MTNNRVRPVRTALAAAAAATLCTGALAATAPSATAGGGHGGGHHGGGYGDRGVVIPLSAQASKDLRKGDNNIVALGKADRWAGKDRVVLKFPIAGGDHRKGRSGAIRLKGGIGFTGAGPNVTWTKLKIGDRGVISAVLSGGDRSKVLKVAGKRHHRGTDKRGGGLKLVLTPAGAASLNRAAAGSPFDAGDVFAGGNDCR